MPEFYLTLKAILPDKNVFEGNGVMRVLTERPTVKDFIDAKSRYCELLMDRRIYTHTDHIVITMCVPCS